MTEGMWIIDAFTSKPFRGNPAGVCLVERFPSDEQMQLTALQVYLSETAFAVKNAQCDYNLRWFTPEAEVDLCGHATLATTHALTQAGDIKPGDIVTYHTRSGALRAHVLKQGAELDFPTLAGEQVKPPAVLNALGVDIINCEKNCDNYLVEVKNLDALIACRPDFKKLAKMDAQGVIVTTATGITGYDFASRYFAPGVGIDEDPVCGSAHCFLAPYWAKRLNKTTFRAFTASRGEGELDVTLNGERTLIAGRCITTLKGQLNMPVLNKKKKEPIA